MDDLTRRLKAHDADAFEQLYDSSARRAFGIAYSALRDGGTAEDVVHEAFLELWNNADRLDERRGRPEALLLTITHRRAIDAVRRRARQRVRGATDPDHQIDERAADLLERAEFAFDREAVTAALGRLSAHHSEVIHLAYFEQLSQREIAARLEVPLGTVKSRLHHAMQHLREAFGLVETSRHGLR